MHEVYMYKHKRKREKVKQEGARKTKRIFN